MTTLETIIKIHEKLIYKIASRFYNTSKEDLYQAGVIGLIKAYNNFKDDGKTKFTTYAYNYIFGEMYELSNNLRTIKLNKNILQIYKRIEKAKYLMSQSLNRMPSYEELSTYLEIDIETIRQIEVLTSNIMSLDNEEHSIYETLPDRNTPNIDLKMDIDASLQNLSDEEKEIIKYRYYKDYTQSETANILGLSQVTVSRYEKKSLKKMYNYLH